MGPLWLTACFGIKDSSVYSLRSFCGALVRAGGKAEESLISNNHSTLLVLNKEKKAKNVVARTYDGNFSLSIVPTMELQFQNNSKTISRGRKSPIYLFLGSLEAFYGVFWPFFTISTSITEPNLTYIKLMF